MSRFKQKIEAGIEIGPPVGTILGHHKDLSGVPGIPGTWVACDGQTINDPDSPLDGITVPDLNSTGRFLRGSGTSGNNQSDNMPSHSHSVDSHDHGMNHDHRLPIGWDGNNIAYFWGDNPEFGSEIIGNIVTSETWHETSIDDAQTATGSSLFRVAHSDNADTGSTSGSTTSSSSPGTSTQQGVSGETRPTNMSVNWIIRIK